MKGTVIMKKFLRVASIGKYMNCLRPLSKHPSRTQSFYAKSSKSSPMTAKMRGAKQGKEIHKM
jgi:hypothetical protein